MSAKANEWVKRAKADLTAAEMLQTFDSEIAGLTPYAVEGRYPTDIPLDPPKEEGQAFLQQAKNVLAFVQKKLDDQTSA